MNRFRTKKRAKDDIAAGRSSQDSEASTMPSFKGFRRGKKSHEEEPKKEIDLTSALPSNDDFRTSLLMTNLSARFSMLREQDDPNTKIGKASDDSVLFPKRQSRLMEYGFSTAARGLTDIAEVESIKAPPSIDRIDSFISDQSDSARSGGIMNRAKPTEGNNLFGGRQKIYKIPMSAKSANGGVMSGKALYDDDVALSAFQRWRQAEREKAYYAAEDRADDDDDGETFGHGDEDSYPTRGESPMPTGYNQKRETSSTTSSASGLARNSTAATSVTSQLTASGKDWQSGSAAGAASSSPSIHERNVMRTRRLYEQGLTQELQDQQSSALSRIDTLARQRAPGTLTPDLATTSPSPTSLAFSVDRSGEKRPILTKGSAPNLRSMSPPATTATTSALASMDFGTKAGSPMGGADARPNLHGSPPLSPPVSETGEQIRSLLAIQPNDRGKATAMGVFQKPVQPYDESRYAQRQLQLQQGRDTPRQERLRTGSDASSTGRSRSSSSAQHQFFDSKFDAGVNVDSAIQENAGTTFFDAGDDSDDSDDAHNPYISVKPPVSPQVLLQRPADEEHPAFRQLGLSTPLSFGDDTETAASKSANTRRQGSSGDSPTLGPTSAGLSGLVRQHLRSDSSASSIYGTMPQSSGPEVKQAADAQSTSNGYSVQANPWNQQDRDWRLSGYSAEPSLEELKGLERQKGSGAGESATQGSGRADEPTEAETDEFANQLADARRRVRERLTSYADSAESSRSGSPVQGGESFKDAVDQALAASLGSGILNSKLSHGSVVERPNKSNVTPQSRIARKQIGVPNPSTSPNPMTESFEEKTPSAQPTRANQGRNTDDDQADGEETGNMHPGLRAFRQARRELQKQTDLDPAQSRQPGQPAAYRGRPENTAADAYGARNLESRQWQRSPSGERKSPTGPYQRRDPSEGPRYSSNSRNASPAGAFRIGGDRGSRQPVDRDRGASGGAEDGRMRSHSRPVLPPFEDQQPGGLGISNGGMPRQPMMRPPGTAGSDVRRSPITPSQQFQGASRIPPPGPSPRLDKSTSAGNLKAYSPRPGYETNSAQSSPMFSPQHGPTGAPSGIPVSVSNLPGVSAPSRRPSAPPASPLESTRRAIDKRDIGEPTLIMSTSRVPTVDLMNGTGSDNGSRSRSNSGGRDNGSFAPPLPPINPRRKREGSRAGGAPPGSDSGMFSPPQAPYASTSRYAADSDDENRSSFAANDEEAGSKSIAAKRSNGNISSSSNSSNNNRLRKVQAEVQALNARAAAANSRSRDNSPPFVAKGPPASRTVVTGANAKRPGMGVPGGLI